MAFFFVFLFGLAVGSFLNAFIYRLELREGLARAPRPTPGVENTFHPRGVTQGRSFCPSCGHQLAWHDLIPLLSFVLLRGKCRYCEKRISLQYPFVELAAGILFVAVFWFVLPQLSLGVENLTRLSFPQAAELVYLWAIASALMVVFVYDLKHFLIPDKVLYPAIGLAVFWLFLEFLNFDIWNLFRISDFGFRISLPIVQAIVAGILASVFFLAIFLLSRGRAMGFGDVKLAFFMGIFLGFPNIVAALASAFLLGAVVGVILILSRKKEMRSEVPFGPFLVLGTLGALFWGKEIVDIYLGLVVG